ncbi:hypothetical protein J421_3113 [Gemmatirosa kalamazoonensis]|uniref:Porin domain-containing protein n=1 Tax=Gemmatirosa kalamazoonensis TaxID=861299 RepID=W0RJY3_9BACT|nr:hypothetical protein [Gemmatirosa kalamazoonensis]AHG90650.1 hypothetical protein J421_3113 [Gemmatirosa kalamazoonensis]
MQSRSYAVAVYKVAVLTFAVAAVAVQAEAQGTVSSACSSQLSVSQDACQKAVDLYNYMAPQLGVSITGGNAVIGNASTLGGLGHFTVGLRANVVRGQLPQTGNVTLSVSGPQSSNFAPRSQVLGLPTADAAIGIFKGLSVGLTNVGGIDALVSAFYVPDIDKDPVSVHATGGRLQLGYGARLGILQETSFVPGISVSVLQRDLPTVDLRARIGTSDSVRVTGLKAKTTAWRLAGSKSFLLVGLTAGVGQDRYDSRADASAFIAPRQITQGITASFNGTVASPSQKMTRTNVFAGASVHLALLRIAAEVGRVSGGSVTTPYNKFGDRRADDPYTYASLGLRVGF